MVSKKIKAAFFAAFPNTIPIFAGFLFLGIAYGIYMNQSGFKFYYPMFMSFIIFAGSVEFATVSWLLGSFDPINIFFLTLMINARHLFYGLSMLEKYNIPGWKKLYLIYGMCDESFSINATVDVPKDIDKGLFMFFVTMLNQIYWVAGATIGGIFGYILVRPLMIILPSRDELDEVSYKRAKFRQAGLEAAARTFYFIYLSDSF